MQRRMVDAALAIPGVTAAAYANTVPLNLDQLHSTVFSDGATDLRDSNAIARILGIGRLTRLLRRRAHKAAGGTKLTWHDDRNAPRVAVVNREIARQVFGSIQATIGGHFTNTEARRIEVIGVVEDGKYEGLTEDPKSVAYYANLQSPSPNMWLVVRSDRDPGQLTAAALNRAMRDLDPGLPFTIRTWEKELGNVLFPARVATVSLGVLGGSGRDAGVNGHFRHGGLLREQAPARIWNSHRPRRPTHGVVNGRPRPRLPIAGLRVGRRPAPRHGRRQGAGFIVFQASPRDPIVLGGALLTMTVVGLLAAWIPAPHARYRSVDTLARGMTVASLTSSRSTL